MFSNVCKSCFSTLGYYCDVADAPISDYTLYECPVGYYCLNGTEFSTQYACPAGTYNPSTRLEREGQCLDCPAGKYCETPGLDTWTGDCQAGYWCILASDSDTPTDGVTGRECPEGKYCVEGKCSFYSMFLLCNIIIICIHVHLFKEMISQ